MTDIIELIKQDEDTDGFNFAIRAMVPESYANKNYCSDFCVMIDNENRLIATDRRRVHIYECMQKYRPGIYRVLKRLKTHVVLLPEMETEYKKGFPEFEKFFELPKDISVIHDMVIPNSDLGIVPAFSKIVRLLPSYQSINPAYLKDLDNAWNAYLHKNNAFIVFDTSGMKASIALTALEE